MKKWGIFFSLWMAGVSAFATTIPDNMYFNAMKDELKRSMAKLHRPGVEKPYFIAYKLEQWEKPYAISASLGSLYPMLLRDSQLSAYAWADIGSTKNSSVGHMHEGMYAQKAYRPRSSRSVPKSYDGIRTALWRLTDNAYTFAAEVYQQKQAYKRTKQVANKDNLPDVIPVKQAAYIEEIPPAPEYDLEQLQTWVKEQSALGKQYPFLEQFAIDIIPVHRASYYLNSRGGFYQKYFTGVHVTWSAKMRDQDGFKRSYNRDIWLEDFSQEQKDIATQVTDGFLKDLQAFYEGVPGERYIGPVLIAQTAAGNFINELLVTNFQNLYRLSSATEDADQTAGSFDEVNQRVMSPGITVWDSPYERILNGVPLGGFMPVDDEGVAAQDLKLVENGRIVEIPRTTRPLNDKQLSNGHARMTRSSMPRERLTNVVVDVENPLSWDDLVQAFLDRCEELGLEYGYVLHEWPNASNNYTPILERVYLDGSYEIVYGLKLTGLTPRALRDILAAGDTVYVTNIESEETSEETLSQSVISPALLIDEMEFSTEGRKPDKKSFVPKP